MNDICNVSLDFVRTDYRMPDESGSYLCITDNGWLTTLEYSKRYNAFNVSDLDDDDYHSPIPVHAWASILPLNKLNIKVRL